MCLSGTVSPDGIECVSCVAGENFAPNPKMSKCIPVKECSAGTYETTAPAADSNRVCTPCPDGTYQSQSGQTSCKLAITCPAGATAHFNRDATRLLESILPIKPHFGAVCQLVYTHASKLFETKCPTASERLREHTTGGKNY